MNPLQMVANIDEIEDLYTEFGKEIKISPNLMELGAEPTPVVSEIGDMSSPIMGESGLSAEVIADGADPMEEWPSLESIYRKSVGRSSKFEASSTTRTSSGFGGGGLLDP